jgi:hypothetical protein
MAALARNTITEHEPTNAPSSSVAYVEFRSESFLPMVAFATGLKAELELHTSLEEQHLFPILRRNPETKGLVAEAVKDNKELRSKLVELDALPKDDETFYERLKELQKSFRQHARDVTKSASCCRRYSGR